jgi:adenylate cyclase
MFTDMVGYSALTQRDERLALALLHEQRQLLRPIFAEHGGREVKETGDGFLVEFASALQAARCSVAIQRALTSRNSAEASARRIEIRIGLHLGDVEVRDGDLLGDGVNIAARLEPLADPGGICISGPVFDQIRNKLDAPLVRLGQPELKNIRVPIDVYRVVLPWTPARSALSRRPLARWSLGIRVGVLVAMVAVIAALIVWRNVTWPRPTIQTEAKPIVAPGDQLAIPDFAGRPAIAVLPFDNLSPDPDQAFFADGLAEDLITRLSSWRAFPVIARNSSFHYRGGNLDLKKVGSELGARYLVEGSVRRAGDRIRVTAQLIDAPSGEHVWGETYDRDVKDVFTLQDEITSTIAASIASDLTRVENERASSQRSENLQAWSLYETAWPHVYKFTREENAEARRLLDRAVALDPHFATALATLSMTHSWDVVYGWTASTDQSLAAALEIGLRAIKEDPRDPMAHAAVGAAYVLKGDASAGLDSTRHAVELNPSMPEAWLWHGWAQLVSGNPDGCIASNVTAQRLNPQGEAATVAWDNMALCYWETGRYDASLDAARHLIAARPDYWFGQVDLALSDVSLGHIDEARAAIAEARRLQPDISIAKIQHSYGVSRPEVDARRNAALREAGLD